MPHTQPNVLQQSAICKNGPLYHFLAAESNTDRHRKYFSHNSLSIQILPQTIFLLLNDLLSCSYMFFCLCFWVVDSFFFGYYSSFLFWVTSTSFVALSGFGLNFLFHSGLTKLQFCFHFNLKHGFWDCIGYDSMKISTLLSMEDPDNYSFSTKLLIQLPMLINALLFIKCRGFHVSDL